MNEPTTERLTRLESAINDELSGGGSAARVRLFRDPEGVVGVSFLALPGDGSLRVLDTVYVRIKSVLGVRRGRPRLEPTKQVKCRVPESVHDRLVEEAQRRGITVSRLVAQLAGERLLELGVDNR